MDTERQTTMALDMTVTLRSSVLNSTEFSNYTELPLLPYRSPLSIGISSVVVGLICLVSILGNVAVIYAIISTYEMREKVSNIFLINLSITDLSCALFIMFSAFICIAFDLHSVNTIWCNFMCAVNYCLIIVSMMTLALISVDRLLSVLYPFRYYDLVTKARVITVIICTWFEGLIFGIAPALKGWVHYDYWEAICAINWHHEPRSGPINYVIAAFAICFILPAVTMLICYTVTIRFARKSINNMMPASSASRSDKGSTTDKKRHKDSNLGSRIITSLLVVVALFFVFLTPFSVTKLLKVLTNDSHYVPPYVNLWSAFFAYLSSMVNPFVYGIFRADFRHAYRMMLRKIAAKRDSNFVETSVGARTVNHSETDEAVAKPHNSTKSDKVTQGKDAGNSVNSRQNINVTLGNKLTQDKETNSLNKSNKFSIVITTLGGSLQGKHGPSETITKVSL